MAAGKKTEVTFYKDVLPVLQKNCQECHRAGEAAPMELFTYQQVRPWAKAMREAVLTKKMPPWFADPHVGKFSNDRSMAQAEIDTLAGWADSGAKEGNKKDAPPPRTFATGWYIGKPDVVIEMPEPYDVPASGTIEYTYYIVPTGFTEDKWVQLAEARPGDRSVVHHIIAFAREPNSKWLRDYPVKQGFVPKRRGEGGGEGGVGGGEFISGFAPGAPPEMLRPGQGKLIKAGSDIVFQMHYTTNGKAARDQSKLGLIFSKDKPEYRVVTLAAMNGKFVIPPGAPAHAVDGAITLHGDTRLISLFPHMHLRGKSMEMRAVYPTGEMEKLLWVPNYDFSWQLWYQLPEPKLLPKGTRIEATGTFDNSPNNPHNPDPTKEVRWGDQSWEEMMIGFFDVAIEAGKNPIDVLRAPRRAAPGSEN
ncbi:MAG: thiol-disulfide isomerase [Acidimicrobiia bacterium]|nr:thiol-disulfide isomerase [Acidimicrobiia bacterium]